MTDNPNAQPPQLTIPTAYAVPVDPMEALQCDSCQ